MTEQKLELPHLATETAVALRCIEDPVFFVTEIIGAIPEQYQADLLRAVAANPYVAAHTGHGVGKTTFDAWLMLWFIFCHIDSKVITTAPTWRQVKDLLWTEAHKWARKMDLSKMGWMAKYTLLDTRLEISEEWFATGESSDDPVKLEGYHAEDILYIVDEAKGVPDGHFDSMDGGMTTAGARMCLTSTPGDTTGKLWNVCSGKEDKEKPEGDPTRWVIFHVNAEDSDRVSDKWIEGRGRVWGKKSALYRIRVKGEFTETTTDTLIPAPWFDAAMERELQQKKRPVRVMSVDVARYGADRTIIGYREGDTVTQFIKLDRSNIAETSQRVYDEARTFEPDLIVVDEVGIGAGVLDDLSSWRRKATRSRVHGFSGARKPINEDDYYNARAECYWHLRDIFGDGHIAIAIDDENLAGQLTSLRYEYRNKGQHTVILVQSKEEIRRKGDPSPDEADALMMLFCQDVKAPEANIGIWV